MNKTQVPLDDEAAALPVTAGLVIDLGDAAALTLGGENDGVESKRAPYDV